MDNVDGRHEHGDRSHELQIAWTRLAKYLRFVVLIVNWTGANNGAFDGRRKDKQKMLSAVESMHFFNLTNVYLAALRPGWFRAHIVAAIKLLTTESYLQSVRVDQKCENRRGDRGFESNTVSLFSFWGWSTLSFPFLLFDNMPGAH